MPCEPAQRAKADLSFSTLTRFEERNIRVLRDRFHAPASKPPGPICALRRLAHAVITSLAIEAPSSVKRYCSSTGLPGKSPVTRAVTVTSVPETSTASGSLV